MYESTATECWWYDQEGARKAQAAFEALFPQGHTPKVDVRTPKQVEDGTR